MKIREIMTADVRTVRLEDTLDRVAQIMKAENVGVVPVLDDDRELCGLITDRDIVVRCIADQRDPADTPAEDILTEDLQTISPEADVEEAARIMARRQVRRLPVCDESGELLGMVSLGDLAVKSEDVDVSAEALEDISQGVKVETASRAAGRRPQGAETHHAGTRAAHAVAAAKYDNEEFDLEFSDEKDDLVSAARRTQAAASTRSNRQGITNHTSEEEGLRNARVIPIRKESAASQKRRGRKTG